MRAPLSWLREFVDIDLEPEALAERLTLLGMEVRGIERRGLAWQNVVVGELLSVEKHPNADRLSLTTVTLGAGEPLSIVCGATNIAPGQRVPVALPGAVLPGDRRIERTEKMGVVSNGMLCSGDELELTADGDGILILAPDTPLGVPLAELYGDVIFDIDVKPNRGDALSIVGLAREVAAITGSAVRMPSFEVVESGPDVADRLTVDVIDAALCPRFVGRWVSGVRVGPSPEHVQMRLLAAGVRPISNVVDASNYVMIELGKPIHTFDGSRVERGHLVVRTASSGERLVTLDHVDRALDPDTLLIADDHGPLAIAGVMGGAASEVTDATTDVIIESAIFDPVSIRRTAFHHALRSEASLRFEKGQECRLARLGADRAAALVAAWAGGSVARGRVDTAPDEPGEDRVRFRPARVARILGADLPREAQVDLLARVGIAVASPAGAADAKVDLVIAAGSKPRTVQVPAAATLEAVVPSWRRDLAIEADIIEELARVNGYDRIPSTLPATALPLFRPSPLALRDVVRHSLAGFGLREVVTHALVSPDHLARWSWSAPPAPADGEGRIDGTPITVTNPLSADHAVLRQDLVGGLVDTVVLNRRRGRDDLALFEIGKGYGRVADAPHEWWRLGFALAGAFDPPSWNRPRRAADLGDAKGVLDALCATLGLDGPEYTALATEAALHPGQAVTVLARTADGTVGLSGVVGAIHPAAAAAWDERAEGTILAEISIRGLSGGVPSVPRGVNPSRFPSVERDLAIVVGAGETAGRVEAVIRASAGALLRSVELFDVYAGAPLGRDERSLAFRIVFGTDERTLADDEVEAAVGAISAAIIDAGGRIRS
ncbi:MAG: phenylalanine--tRNA ligase subunit beta [Chloroflexota bacterium]|nr:MAG: phenylalanine--tRNA ligase subunit beta [Chloroflexota bacterium]